MGPIGGGLALVDALGKYADEEEKITWFYETAARTLIQDNFGSVTGIKAISKNNSPVELKANNIILACGGFEGNPEMLSHYVGAQAQFIRPVSRGGHYNRGEGIKMALDIGAAPCGDYGGFHTAGRPTI